MRRLPTLDSVRVASPCTANWAEMTGNDRVRFCGSCQKNVYNLSAMLADEAQQLLVDNANGEMCVRFYQRADGTVMTQDCPVGAKKKQRKMLALAVAGAGAMVAAAATALFREQQGDVAVTQAAAPCEVAANAASNGDAPVPPVLMMGDVAPSVMGSVAPPPPPPPEPTGHGAAKVPTKPHLMGRMVRSKDR